MFFLEKNCYLNVRFNNLISILKSGYILCVPWYDPDYVIQSHAWRDRDHKAPYTSYEQWVQVQPTCTCTHRSGHTQRTGPTVGHFSQTSQIIPFYRAMLCSRGTSHGTVSVSLSVRPSVTSRSSTKTDKRTITPQQYHTIAHGL